MRPHVYPEFRTFWQDSQQNIVINGIGKPARGVPAGVGPGALLLVDGVQHPQRRSGRQGDQIRALRGRRAQREVAGMQDVQ